MEILRGAGRPKSKTYGQDIHLPKEPTRQTATVGRSPAKKAAAGASKFKSGLSRLKGAR